MLQRCLLYTPQKTSFRLLGICIHLNITKEASVSVSPAVSYIHLEDQRACSQREILKSILPEKAKSCIPGEWLVDNLYVVYFSSCRAFL